MRIVGLLCAAICVAYGQVSVTTAQYNAHRTGSNSSETALTPDVVNSQRFGKLFSREVDDSIYASPLILSGVRIPGIQRTRNIMVVATMSNTVYVFDADDAKRAAPYWTRQLGTPAAGDDWIGPVNHGILSTPVFDTATDTIYVVAKIRSGGESALWLHALDVSTGALKYNSPARITFPFAEGYLITNVPGAIQRAGLLIWNNTLYAAFANILIAPDSGYLSQEGFVQAFDARDLSRRLGCFQVTPSGQKGGIWQAGRGLAADANGVYVATAGGTYDGVSNFGSTFLRLSHGALSPVDWLTPADHETLFHSNLDPSANGITLIPNTSQGFGGGKNGVIYLFDRNRMGRLETGPGSTLQKFRATDGCGATDCAQTPGTAFWSGADEGRLFVWDRGDTLRSFVYRNSRFETTAGSQSEVRPVMTSGPAVSSNGADLNTVIVWAVTANQNANNALVPGTLRAFRGSDVAQELYNSDRVPARDAIGHFTKFAPPVIANGRVYIVTHSNAVHVYGALRGNPRK